MASDPLRTGGVRLLALVGIPVVLVVLLVTIVGIPLALVDAFVFALALWVAPVYGRFAVDAWPVSLADVESRWAGLLVGVALGHGAYRGRDEPAGGRQTTLDEVTE